MDTYIYDYNDKLYINLTNKCSNSCVFCVRNTSDGVGGSELWIEREPGAEEITALIEARGINRYGEFVFCGFGEPLYALENVISIGKYLRAKGKSVRLNTNGQASLIAGEGVAHRLREAVNTVSISLNASSAKKYDDVCKCAFGEEGYRAMLTFARECVGEIDRTVLSVVDTIGEEEIKKCKKIAEDIGAELRVRVYEAY